MADIPEQPTQEAITAAIHAARRGRALGACAKSSRGAAVFSRALGVFGTGYNAQPAPRTCSGSATCRKECGRLCVHAEEAAIMAALPMWAPAVRGLIALEIVHVKIDERGELVAGGPPSCEQCSRLILHVELSAMWLYEVTPEERCPHLVEHLRTECPLCQGEDCAACRPGPGRPRCDHDVLDRHGELPIVHASWRRYTAERFHEETLRNLRLGAP